MQGRKKHMAQEEAGETITATNINQGLTLRSAQHISSRSSYYSPSLRQQQRNNNNSKD